MRRLLLLLALLPVLAACERTRVISFDRWVDTMVQLRRLSLTTATEADFNARKRQLQLRRGVTDADLQAFERAHQDDVAYMSTAWDSVEARLSRLAHAEAESEALRARAPGAAPARDTAVRSRHVEAPQ